MARNTLFTDNTTRADSADLGAVWDPYTGYDAGRINSNLIKPASIVNFAGQEPTTALSQQMTSGHRSKSITSPILLPT